jgi:hypothetical protein
VRSPDGVAVNALIGAICTAGFAPDYLAPKAQGWIVAGSDAEALAEALRVAGYMVETGPLIRVSSADEPCVFADLAEILAGAEVNLEHGWRSLIPDGRVIWSLVVDLPDAAISALSDD